jgi:hypothetical protein
MKLIKKNPVTEINDSLNKFRALLETVEYLKGSDLWNELEVICLEIAVYMDKIEEDWEW